MTDKKIAIYYSIYVGNENIALSLSYILQLCNNIKFYNANKLKDQNLFIVVETDNFTKSIIAKICDHNHERIDLADIIFHINRKNPDSTNRGMFWRFKSLTDVNYDITICGEGDNPLPSQLKYVKFFIDANKQLLINIVKNPEKTNCYINGGFFMAMPRLIKQELRDKISGLLELYDNLDCLSYRSDEMFLQRLIEKRFNSDIAILYSKNIPITYGLTCNNIQDAKNFIINSLAFSNLIEIENTDKEKISDLCKYEISYTQYKDTFNNVLTNGRQTFYVLDNVCYRLREAYHGRANEFTEKRLLNLIDPLI